MKRFILILMLLSNTAGYSQSLPTDIPKDIFDKLNDIQENARLRLKEFRISREGRLVYSNRLSSEFRLSDRKRIDSLGLKLHISMVFDQPMRNRVLQLIKGEYEEYELDTLTNRLLNTNVENRQMEAMELCMFDTLEIYKILWDSLTPIYQKEKPNLSPAAYKYEIFFHMRLDTSECFIRNFAQLNEKLRQWDIKHLLDGNVPFQKSFLAELAGHLGDSMFVKPLISALDKPDRFRQQVVLNALVRMRVEPYLSEYIKNNTFTLEEIKNGRFTDIRLMIDIWRTQEAFLELSKFLFSDVGFVYVASDAGTAMIQNYAQGTFFLLHENILNEDFQMLISAFIHPRIKAPDPGDPIFEIVYQWMQQNYGKYQIKRLW